MISTLMFVLAALLCCCGMLLRIQGVIAQVRGPVTPKKKTLAEISADWRDRGLSGAGHATRVRGLLVFWKVSNRSNES